MEASMITSLAGMIGSAVTSNVWIIIYEIITAAAFFFLFEEAGDQGWKRFIPIYGTYTAYKLFYSKGKFVLYCISIIVLVLSLLVVAACGAYVKEINGGVMADDMALITIGAFALFIISLIIIICVSIGFDFSICKKHGKKGLFVFGMVFFTPVFLAALAWENRKKLN